MEHKKIWKCSPKSNGRTTKVVAFNIDLDLLKKLEAHAEAVGNKSRVVNEILRKYFDGNLEERK